MSPVLFVGVARSVSGSWYIVPYTVPTTARVCHQTRDSADSAVTEADTTSVTPTVRLPQPTSPDKCPLAAGLSCVQCCLFMRVREPRKVRVPDSVQP
eukprot:3883677-Prymnesium_polylepis.2